MNLLSMLVFSPLLGILVLLWIPKTQEYLLKGIGLFATLPALILSLSAFFQYRSGADLTKWDEQFNWISFKSPVQYGDLFSVQYELGVDGLSLVMIVLTAIIATLASIASIQIKKEWKGYFILFLLLEIGMLGVFAAENLILFFLFFEMTLISTFFLIGKWGYVEREKAAYHFLIYNGLGSAILLIVIIVLFARTGTSNIEALQAIMTSDNPQLVAAISEPLKYGLFIAFFFLFGVKFRLFHWLA